MSSINLLLFVLLSDTVFLSVVVILLLVEMSCFYDHVSNGSLMISSVAMLVLIIMSFCIIFRLDALALSVIATATWLAGWVAGCPSQPVLYQND